MLRAMKQRLLPHHVAGGLGVERLGEGVGGDHKVRAHTSRIRGLVCDISKVELDQITLDCCGLSLSECKYQLARWDSQNRPLRVYEPNNAAGKC